MNQQDDWRLLDAMRMSETLPTLSARLKQAATAWGFNDVYYAAMSGDSVQRLDLRVQGEPDDQQPYSPTLASIVIPLLDVCRRKIAPVFWRSDETRRTIQVFDVAQPLPAVGVCGVSIPIHGPTNRFGMLTVSSDCSAGSPWAADRLSTLHAMAMIVHDHAMRNCGSTRFSLQYETVDVPRSLFSLAVDGHTAELPTIH